MPMSEIRASGGTARFEVRPTADSHFSWLRTRLSVERTLMSLMRTGVAFIGFGFTIYEFLARFNQTPGVPRARFPEAPRYLGLALIGAGIVALLIALWEYRWVVRYLWSKEYSAVAGIHEVPSHTPILVLTILLILTGVFAFVAVATRH